MNSEKNANVTSDTRKNAIIAAWPGHDLLGAVGVRVTRLHERGPEGGFEERHVMIGNTTSTMIGNGSRRMSRTSWARITPRRRE